MKLIKLSILVSLLTISACSTPHEAIPTTTAQATATNQALPPVMVTPAEVKDNIIELPLDQLLVLSVDTPAADWQAEIADETIATFTAGYSDGSALFNPGFEPHREGETRVTAISPEQQRYDFTLRVIR